MSVPETPPVRPGLSTPLRWLLVVSLAVNLLIAGLAVGAVLRHGGPHGHMELGPGPIVGALSPEDRRAVLQALGSRPGFGPPGREERRAAVAEVLAAVRSEPFDRARAEAALATQARRFAEVQQAVQEAVLDRIAAMTPEERAAFADRVEANARGAGERGD